MKNPKQNKQKKRTGKRTKKKDGSEEEDEESTKNKMADVEQFARKKAEREKKQAE